MNIFNQVNQKEVCNQLKRDLFGRTISNVNFSVSIADIEAIKRFFKNLQPLSKT